MKIREGDVVQVLSGKDRGKQGRVVQARPSEGRVLVENVNIVKRHRRPKPIKDSSRMGGQQVTPGGVIEMPAPLNVANVMIVCPVCNRATRVGYEFRTVKGDQVKVRVCKRADCGQVLDRGERK
jgi:large subunit ribosomal protein L24